MNLYKKILRSPYKFVVKIAKKITDFNYVFQKNKELEEKLASGQSQDDEYEKYKSDYEWGYPKGHFYSSVHCKEDLAIFDQVAERERNTFKETLPNFSDAKMIREFNRIKKYFKEFKYPQKDDGKSRFYVKNVSLSLMDELVLFAMIREKKPKKIIEIGSGFSSGLMMEINEKFFKNKIDITFIEPYTYLLKSRMKEGDEKRYKIIEKGVQFVPLEIFQKLESGDMLFIDSTHVSKFNSDVNYEIFHILPKLKPGVIIHFHDILDGFEYPINWLNEGWAWNEQYLLRAFLMNNNEYQILLMTNYLTNRYQHLLEKSYDKNILYGGQLWLQKNKL